MSLMVYAAFLYRLMTQKLPKESLRPGMFISVGPSGFTIAGVITMAQNLPGCIPENFMGVGEMAGVISVVMANWMGIWLWGLAIFFFIVSCGAHWSCVRHGRLQFALTWYSFIFPNTGLTVSPLPLLHHDSLKLTTTLDCHFCRSTRPRSLSSHPYSRLCAHLSPRSGLVLRLWNDDPCRHSQGHSLAAEARRP